MALTNIQREVCRVLDATRISQDLDLFHDTAAALAATWSADRAALLDAGYEIEVVRERPTFVEAIVRRGTEAVILQWTHDSAFRSTSQRTKCSRWSVESTLAIGSIS